MTDQQVEPEDFDYFQEHFRVRADIETPDGVVNVMLSRPFETATEAEQARAAILSKHPQAQIFREKFH